MSCWELEVEACVLAKKSCWTADSDATGFMFCVHLSKGTLKSRQSILPRGDGAFPTIQLPLLGKNLPAAQWPPHLKETEPYTNQQAETDVTTRSKLGQVTAQNKTTHDRW
jgi:hypothetical protein